MSDAAPGSGNIEIELVGQGTLTLIPTLDACIKISNMAGGLNSAVQRCLALDMGTICEVIAAGLNLNPTQAKKIPEAVFQTGLIGLHALCIDFIHIVANGGRPPEPDGEDEQGPGPPNPA